MLKYRNGALPPHFDNVFTELGSNHEYNAWHKTNFWYDMHKIKTVFTIGPKTLDKFPEFLKKVILFFTLIHLLWVDFASIMNELVYLFISFFFNFLLPQIFTMIKWTVHKKYICNFPHIRLPHLSCIVLSCPILSVLSLFYLFFNIFSVRGCKKYQDFAFCISSILCLCL